MKKFLKILAISCTLIAISCFLSGCHPAELVIPSYIHTVGVEPVKNQTSYFGLDTTFTEDLIRQFQVDARLTVDDPTKSDMVVKIVIRQYTINPIYFDPKTNLVLQYQLTMVYDIAAIDQVEKKTLMEDTGKQHSVYYYTPQYVGAITETQDQAAARMIDEATQLTVRQVLEGF